MPSKNQSINIFRDYVEMLSDIVNMYTNKGEVIVMGDINVHISSPSFVKPIDDRGKLFIKFLEEENLFSACNL